MIKKPANITRLNRLGAHTRARARGRAAAVCIAVFVLAIASVLFAIPSGASYADDSVETTQNKADTLGIEGVSSTQAGNRQYNYDQEGRDAIADLLNVDEGMDNKIVTINGEVVGEATIADDTHQWVTVSQDGSAISVYMNEHDANQIQHFGRYGEIGDIIAVIGTFHVDCEEHVGDIDIHANSVEIITGGSATVHEIDTLKLYIALGIAGLGVLLGIIYWRLSERLR